MTVVSSIDSMLANDADYGMLRRLIIGKFTNPTAATVNCGGTSISRSVTSFTMPALGSGINSAYFTYVRINGSQAKGVLVAALEIPMGTLTVSGNSFADGSACPTRTVEGASLQMASCLPVVVATTALTATTPVLTITYTDQDGNTSQTCTMTLPTNCVINSGYYMAPHLASGDTGVQDITNMSISTGSAGVLKVFGLFPIGISLEPAPATSGALDPLGIPLPLYPIVGSDIISFYGFGITGAQDFLAVLSAVGDT